MRGTPDQDGLVLPAVSVDGRIVGVKTIILQTVKSGDTEKTRVVTRSSSRSVSPRVIKATWSVRGFLFLLQNHVIRYGINDTYYSVKPVKICFHVPLRG